VWVDRLRRATSGYLLDPLCDLVVRHLGDRLYVIGGSLLCDWFGEGYCHLWDGDAETAAIFAPLKMHRPWPTIFIADNDRLTAIGSHKSGKYPTPEQYNSATNTWSKCTYMTSDLGTLTLSNWLVHRPPRKSGEHHSLFAIAFNKPHKAKSILSRLSLDKPIDSRWFSVGKHKMKVHCEVPPLYDVYRDVIWVCRTDGHITCYNVQTDTWKGKIHSFVSTNWHQFVAIPDDPHIYWCTGKDVHAYSVDTEKPCWTTYNLSNNSILRNDRHYLTRHEYCFIATFNRKIIFVAGCTDSFADDIPDRRSIITWDPITKLFELVATLVFKKSQCSLLIV
jgi:hypothetical protein